MQSKAKTPEEYLKSLPEDRRKAINQLRKVIKKNLPRGFREEMGYGMLGYVVPHSIYPNGYHCTPDKPLPFMGIASQKNFIGLYHMGIYSDKKLYEWFTKNYAEQSRTKPDMGKSCIRFKKIDAIPFQLVGELASKMTPQDWISIYESMLKRKK